MSGEAAMDGGQLVERYTGLGEENKLVVAHIAQSIAVGCRRLKSGRASMWSKCSDQL